MTEPERPILRWHGGKWMLAPWIIAHFPDHRVYVEPFGGAASVLLRKPRAYAEVYGDLDDELVNLFRVLRSRRARALVQQLRLTPFSRSEFEEAYLPTEDELERARRMIIRSYMGFGTPGAFGRSTGFRADSNKSGTTPAHDWRNFPDALPAIIERLRGVVIEKRPAMKLMAKHDSPDTLHYVDPPYLPETRGTGNPHCTKHKYRHELTEADHAELLRFLDGLAGMVVLSGYPSDPYDQVLPNWTRVQRDALADGARKRIEVLWINPAAAERMGHGPLFEGLAA
jgi:DNA adenine methylase